MPNLQNFAAGMQMISQGMGQVSEGLLLPGRVEQMKLENEFKTNQLEAQKETLKLTRQQGALLRLGQLSDVYPTDGKGADVNFFSANQKAIEESRNALGWSDDEVKLFIKKPSVRFKKTKEATIQGLNALATSVGAMGDLEEAKTTRDQLFGLTKTLQDIDDPTTFKEVASGQKETFEKLIDLLGTRYKTKKAAEKEEKKETTEKVKLQDKAISDMADLFQKDVVLKKADTAFAQLDNLQTLIDTSEKNPIAAASIPTLMSRFMGEVGNLAAHDKAPFGGDRAINEKLFQGLTQMTKGTLTPTNRRFLGEIVLTIKKSRERQVRERKVKLIEDNAGQSSFVPKEEFYRRLNVQPATEQDSKVQAAIDRARSIMAQDPETVPEEKRKLAQEVLDKYVGARNE